MKLSICKCWLAYATSNPVGPTQWLFRGGLCDYSVSLQGTRTLFGCAPTATRLTPMDDIEDDMLADVSPIRVQPSFSLISASYAGQD